MSRRIIRAVIVSALALLAAGCAYGAAPTPAAIEVGEAEYMREVEADEGVMDAPAEPGGSAGNTAASIERLIIRNASLDLVVADTEAAFDEIIALVDELGGYIVESSKYQYREGLQASVTFRVPVESLDSALARIRDLATEVRDENISGKDVTSDYVDYRSRLRHLEATEETLLDIMAEAEDTEAALNVFEDLRGVQAEIEQVKGQMQYLEESAAMSSVSLTITPDALAQPIQVGGWHPEGTLRDSVQGLVRVLQFLVDAAIVIVVLIAPILVVVALPFVVIFFIIRAIVRRRRARKVS